MRIQDQQQPRSGFTLVEILVVIAIVLLASLIAIPTLVTNLNGRQVTDAARIFSGALVGARDSAIRYNNPRGIRLLPDPVLTIPAPGQANAGSLQLCYNRMIEIEPAGDYSEGRISIGPQYTSAFTNPSGNFPPRYPRPFTAGDTYNFPPTAVAPLVSTPSVLMVEEAPLAGGFATLNGQPNSPTNWYWNVRVGDKIKIGGTGRAYTIVGPCVVNPWTDLGSGIGNNELFVNVGAPGTTPPLIRRYYSQSAATVPPTTPTFTALTLKRTPEFLFVVNGEDDDLDGYVDSGWDGYDNNGNGLYDEPAEWEVEKWVGSLMNNIPDLGGGTDSPSLTWIATNYQTGTHDSPYIIQRRPVPSEGAREVMLPAGMVIDATTSLNTPTQVWSNTRERSRIPISAGSLYCDIMVNPSGLYIPTTEYSSPTSAPVSPFLHFWITDRNDVYPVGTIWKDATSGAPTANPSSTATVPQTYLLPMTSDTTGFPPSAGLPTLKYDRRLVTMFTQSGLVVTNTIESIPSTSVNYLPGEGFNVLDVGYPFYKAQLGQREAR